VKNNVNHLFIRLVSVF